MKLLIYTDGGSRGNPGRSAAAFYIPQDNVKRGIPLPDTTNNVAEYTGLLEALKYALYRYKDSVDLHIHSDSELMVKQMTGAYRVKSPSLLDLWAEATAYTTFFPSVEFTHVMRENNKVADEIVNRTMDWMDREGGEWTAAHCAINHICF